ncbi:ABC transporter permease subunit [Streptococcus catagoni]|uniref:ABC transporter permease subunit n=1 Tax=Streptococcus catagoni TaxID=2654874 RepID=UPI00140D26D0|nr:ABC transporter permease subunit [Streptococcus catagoni]
MIIRHEYQEARKSLLIWAIAVGLSSALCILLYQNLADSIKEIAHLYQDMGGISKALGMDKVSIASLSGYYSAEIALIYSLGAAIFAALLGVTIISKEEEGHTAEFLFTLPYSRQKVLRHKFLSLLLSLFVFNLIAIGIEYVGLIKVSMNFDYEAFYQYHALVFLMQVEIASLAFLISSFSRKKQVGLGVGMVLLAYFMDIICRLIEDVSFLKYLTPFYYANATDRFAGEDLDWLLLLIACLVSLLSYLLASLVYRRRDLAT